ncbi:hypothetical protein FG05_12095 [Fusarium graminearum]|nr:hypothetical protein FG05_12095 [Fusarium graminearum]
MASRTNNPSLCQDCQIWDNIESFKDFWPKRWSFVTLDGLAVNAPCIICAIVKSTVESRLLEIGISSNSSTSGKHARAASDSTCLFKKRIFNAADSCSPLDVSIIWRNTSVESVICILLDTCLFDVALLKQWLMGCADLHGNECKKNPTINLDDLPPGFRLINLKSMSIEQPKSNKGFVALSYMWPSETDSERVQLQKHNVELWKKPGDLRNISMPPLISDAMSLCQKLGETYIWIDRFCIVQDDAASKHGQVSGFIHRPRGSTINKLRIEHDWKTLVVERGLESVNYSIWNTRGWTFQERLLSSRCIYITEHEVQYECYVGYASEIFTHNAPYKTSRRSLSHPLTKRPVSQLPGFCASRVANFHITEKTSIYDYMRLVRDYTRRNLSYSSDILNAFAGVERRLKDV